MARRGNRHRRRRRLRAKLDSEASESSSPQSSKSSSPQSSGSSSDDRAAQRKIPLPRDARDVRPFLLGVIRGYYIDAIARLPGTELRTTLARGLLVGGHCYGPLHPVHNIILNSVWYATAFPFRADPIDVDVISTEGIERLAHRSLDGLVAYLGHDCPDLSHDDALWHLALSHAVLHGASATARGAVPFGRTELEPVPFQVAAQAAQHPKPSALTHFVTSVLPPVERDARQLFAGRRRLSSHDILHLSAMLQSPSRPDAPLPQPYSRQLSLRIGRIIDEKRRIAMKGYQALLGIADAALRKFARQTGASYCLHTTYSHSAVKVQEGYFDRYLHINFMAWPECKQSQSQTPVHFFAEAHNPPNTNCSEEHITFCCMLVHTQPSPSHVGNCYACMRIKTKFDHPNGEEHFGGHPHKTGESETEDDRDCPTFIDVDYRFFDPDRDIDLVKWYADRIEGAKAVARPKPRSAEDDSDSEDDQDDEDGTEKDFSRFCRRYG